MKMLTRAYYEAFVTMVERKGGHGNDNETVPRQRSGSGNSIEITMQRRSVGMRAKDVGALPDSGCPTSLRHGNG